MDLEKLRADLIAKRGQWRAISAHTKLSMSWLSKFANRHIASPRVTSAERLQAALASLQ
jgi:hypothetical protein